MPYFPNTASPQEKIDNILYHFYIYESPQNGAKGKVGGITIDAYNHFSCYDPKVFGLSAKSEMKLYLDTLIDLRYIETVGKNLNSISDGIREPVAFPEHLRLTFQGLAKCYELENSFINSKKCFVAMVFDADKTHRLNSIKAACAVHGFEAFDVESYHIEGNHTIDTKIIAAIKTSRFCIVDFTKLNQGAYFEGGYAMGAGNESYFCMPGR